MTTENATPTEGTEEKKSAVVSLRKLIEEQISISSDHVVNRVTDHFVEEELARRADLLVKGFIHFRNLQSEGRKLENPDVKTHAADGTETKVYSESRWKLVREAREKLAKAEKIINACMASKPTADDFNKLSELVAKAPKAESKTPMIHQGAVSETPEKKE